MRARPLPPGCSTPWRLPKPYWRHFNFNFNKRENLRAVTRVVRSNDLPWVLKSGVPHWWAGTMTWRCLAVCITPLNHCCLTLCILGR